MIGSSLGPYKILEPLGAGGMGEVYLAEDTRLGRKVAVKVLPEEFAADPERLARFEQEARAAAALNHPHIATVFDVGFAEGAGSAGTRAGAADAGTSGAGGSGTASAPQAPAAGVHYMVQEYLEGTTLREPLDKGALPLKKALALAVEVAEALRAAHAAGIVHRDLKPDNVFVTEDGHAKVLDFGLAKLIEMSGPGGKAGISMSPTVLGTVAGQIMGTAGYMSPEQVEGDADIDGRADIFAFGCVLYEMAVGRRAFGGDSVLDTLHAIARTDPQPIGEINPDAPAELGRILDKCLAKERERRYQHADDLLVDLRRLTGEVGAGTALSFAHGSTVTAATVSSRRLVPWVAAALVVGAVLGALFVDLGLRGGATPGGAVSRFKIDVSDTSLDTEWGPAVLLSPDGQTLAYKTSQGLWVRSLGSFDSRQIVEGDVSTPVFSPDGQWIAYEQSNTIWRVPVTGGAPLEIARAPNDRGICWGEPEAILLAPDARGPIMRVPVDGSGAPEPVTELTGDDVTHRWPQLLAGGRALLFTAHTQINGFDDANIMVRDLTTGEQRVVFRGGTFARYVPNGHLVYANAGRVFAAPFDIDELAVTGPGVPVLEGVSMASSNGGAEYQFSDNGSLVVVPGGDRTDDALTEWVFVGPDGIVSQAWAPDAFAHGASLSPDGGRLVATLVGSDGEQNLWSWDRERAAATRITFSRSTDVVAVWLPDGRELIYSSDVDGSFRLYRMRADGSGEREPLPDPVDVAEFAQSISADGRWLLTRRHDKDDVRSLWVRDLTGEDAPRLVVESEGTISQAALSPDAEWIAYTSDESGDWEVYAIPFLAEAGEKVTVSVGGGGMPRWSDDGRRIYYRSAGGVSAVDVQVVDGRLRPGAPQPLFEGSYFGGLVGFPYGAGGLTNFDASGDGTTFVMQQATGEVTTHTSAIIVFNWFEELERLVPTGR